MGAWTFTVKAPVSILLAALAFASACRDGLAGPGEPVLIGQFGAADLTLELLATHAGVELSQGCGSYFVSDRPATLDGAGAFRVRGEQHQIAAVGTARGTLSGVVRDADGVETVTLTLLFDEAGPLADPLVVTLRRDEHYEGPELPCPL